MTTGKSNIVDVSLEPRMVRGKAQAFWQGDYKENDGGKPDAQEEWVWLPLSQIEVTEVTDSPLVEVSMPEWLAKDKGLI